MHESFTLGNWEVNPELLVFSNAGVHSHVDSKAMAVLTYLKSRSPHVVPAEELLDTVWNGVVVTDNVVHQAISVLRKRLGDDARRPRFIQTVPKRGYRLLENMALAPALLPALAVLPLTNLSDDATQNYFSGGATQEIWNQLRRLTGVQITSLTSSSRFTDSAMDVREIGEQLSADYLVEGSVNRSADRLRITISVVHARSGTSLLTRSYDQSIADMASLFTIYDDVANDIQTTLSDLVGAQITASP
ncbi:MAG: winged helix-turn-helix domain-containing protein, partial [Pseudomonadales bacterium]